MVPRGGRQALVGFGRGQRGQHRTHRGDLEHHVGERIDLARGASTPPPPRGGCGPAGGDRGPTRPAPGRRPRRRRRHALWGYDITSHPRRRKTLLWSRWPLTEVAALTTGAGAGRVLTAQTVTSIGAVRVVAVCIPWASAHVSTGRRGRDDLVRTSRMSRSDRAARGAVRSADPHCRRRRFQPTCSPAAATAPGVHATERGAGTLDAAHRG